MVSGLVDGAEEVVDGFDGVEGVGGDFNEDCVPLTHGAVPEAGEFECFDFGAVDAF